MDAHENMEEIMQCGERPSGNADRADAQNIQKETKDKETQWGAIPERKYLHHTTGKEKAIEQRPSGIYQQKQGQQGQEETMPSLRETDKHQNKWKELKTQNEITKQQERQEEKEKDHKEQHTQKLNKK